MNIKIPPSFEEIACPIADNKFLSDSMNKYLCMENKHMHKLNGGGYFEERMFRFGLTCRYEQ